MTTVHWSFSLSLYVIIVVVCSPGRTAKSLLNSHFQMRSACTLVCVLLLRWPCTCVCVCVTRLHRLSYFSIYIYERIVYMKEIEIQYDIVLSAMFDYSYMSKCSTARVVYTRIRTSYAYIVPCPPVYSRIRTIMSI